MIFRGSWTNVNDIRPTTTENQTKNYYIKHSGIVHCQSKPNCFSSLQVIHDSVFSWSAFHVNLSYILRVLHFHGSFFMRPANDRRHYIVTSSLVGWAHTQNYLCTLQLQQTIRKHTYYATFPLLRSGMPLIILFDNNSVSEKNTSVHIHMP